MAADKIEVNTNMLNNDVKSLDEYIKVLKSDFENISNGVDSMNRMWQGQANAAFNQQFANDRAKLQNMLDKMSQFTRSVDDARKKYDNCESQVIEMVKSIRV